MSHLEFARWILDHNCRSHVEGDWEHGGFELCCMTVEYRYNRNEQEVEILSIK